MARYLWCIYPTQGSYLNSYKSVRKNIGNSVKILNTSVRKEDVKKKKDIQMIKKCNNALKRNL